MAEKLRAEWFWGDRWMGSSAFLLPLEQRGLYREMLTQAWIRGGSLPKDPQAIQRACGVTPGEWDRCWPAVERYWTTEGDVIFNATQREILADSHQRKDAAAALGKRRAATAKRDKGGKFTSAGPAVGTSGGPKNPSSAGPANDQPPSPSPSPSPSPDQARSPSPKKVPSEPMSAGADVLWLCKCWNDTCGEAGMPRVRLPLGGARGRKLASAMRAANAERPQWRAALLACSKDRHWLGTNDRGWRGTIDSFLEAKHRDRWLDMGVDGNGDERGLPPVVDGQRMPTWDAFYAYTTENTGMSLQEVKEHYGHA